MAQRRMFSKQITDTDAFLDMPATAQNLYFHLNMHADDDGFLGNAKTIRRMVGASEDDLKVLIAKQFILVFPDGVAVIRDWHVHNYIRKDRYVPTVYQSDKKQLKINNSRQYQIHNKEVDTVGIPNVHQMDTEVRLGKSKSKYIDIYSASTEDKLPSSSAKKQNEPHIPYKEIIDYLNQKVGAHYKPSSKANQRLIKARWNEGYRINDFKTVIDNKAFEWQNSDMWRYMRPATLFQASKFDDYLNANNLDKTKNKPTSGGYDTASTVGIRDIPDDELPF